MRRFVLGYFVPVSIGSATSIACHIIFCTVLAASAAVSSPDVSHTVAKLVPSFPERTYSTTVRTLSLDEFRDQAPRGQRMEETVGRAWSVKELRRKDFDDLHRLWYVLYKEKNMLITEKNLSRRKSLIMPQPGRWDKVKKSMAAIKTVMGERKREKLAALEAAEMVEEVHSEDDGEANLK